MIDTNKVIIVGDKVLVKPEKDLEKTQSGLYLPPGVKEKEIVQGGYVIKVGPGYPMGLPSEDDEPWKEKKSVRYIPLQAKEGDFVLFMRKDGIEIEMNKEIYFIIPHTAILLIMRDEDLIN